MKGCGSMKRSVWIFASVLLLAPATSRAQWSDADRMERLRLTEDLLEREPTLSDVRRAALHHFRVSPGALTRVRELTRSKAGAPVMIVSTRFDGTQAQRDLSAVDNGLEWAGADDAFGSWSSTSHLTLSWNFPDTIFTPTELQIYPLDEMQRIILRAINRMYYIRRQLMLSYLIDPPEDDRAIFALRMRIEGFTALLNAYTGGWFVRHLPEDSI